MVGSTEPHSHELDHPSPRGWQQQSSCNIASLQHPGSRIQFTRSTKWEMGSTKCEWNQSNQPVWTASSLHVSPRPLTLSRGSGWYSAVIPGIVAPNCRPFKILFAARGAYHLTDVGECGLCTFRSHCCQFRRFFYVFFCAHPEAAATARSNEAH